VRSIFLSFLGHQADVRDVSHSLNIKLTVLSAVIDDGLVDASVRSIRDTALSVLKLVVFVPHLTSVTDNAGHTGIDDNIRRDMEVSDSLVGVDHGQVRARLVTSSEVSDDSSGLILRALFADGRKD
jgi:hypothetical protein